MQSDSKQERMRALFTAVGIKGEFAKAAKRELRETPEYASARADGRAQEWLEQEAASFAESAYMLLQQRLEDLDG